MDWLNWEENEYVIDTETIDLVSQPLSLNLNSPSQPLIMDNNNQVVRDSILKFVCNIVEAANCSQSLPLIWYVHNVRAELETRLNIYL